MRIYYLNEKKNEYEKTANQSTENVFLLHSYIYEIKIYI